jgi:hypothetical protein
VRELGRKAHCQVREFLCFRIESLHQTLRVGRNQVDESMEGAWREVASIVVHALDTLPLSVSQEILLAGTEEGVASEHKNKGSRLCKSCSFPRRTERRQRSEVKEGQVQTVDF